MQRQAAALLLLLLTATTAAAWDMSMTSLADKLGDAIEVKGIQQGSIQSKLPLVLNVWPFVNATMAGWAALNNASSSTPWLDAVERVRGCHNLQGSEPACAQSLDLLLPLLPLLLPLLPRVPP